MGLFSLFLKKVSQQEFLGQNQRFQQELQQIREAITEEQGFTDQNFKAIESELNKINATTSEINANFDDLKLLGKLAISNNDDISSIKAQISAIESKISQLETGLLNFTKPENGFTERLVNQNLGLVDDREGKNAPDDADFDYRFTKPEAGLVALTNTEKTLLLSLYDLQADTEERAVSLSELMKKIYGKAAKHSKLVYVSKMVKDLVLRGVVDKFEDGNKAKVYLSPEAVHICEQTLRQRGQ